MLQKNNDLMIPSWNHNFYQGQKNQKEKLNFFTSHFYFYVLNPQVIIPWNEEFNNFYGNYFFIIAYVMD